MNDYLQPNELHASPKLADEIEPGRKALLMQEIHSTARQMAKDEYFYASDKKSGGPDRNNPINRNLTPEVYRSHAENILVQVANKMVGGRSEQEQIEAMRRFEQYLASIKMGADRVRNNWDFREMEAYLSEQERYNHTSYDRGAVVLGMAMVADMTPSVVARAPFDLCDHFPTAATEMTDKDSTLITGITGVRDTIKSMVASGALRPGDDMSWAIEKQVAERGVWLPGARERHRMEERKKIGGMVDRVLADTPLAEPMREHLHEAIIEIIDTEDIMPLGKAGEPEDVEGIKAEAKDMRAKGQWTFNGLEKDIAIVNNSRGQGEISLANFRQGVKDSGPNKQDFETMDVAQKAFLVGAAVRALLRSGTSNGTITHGYDNIVHVLEQRPDGPRLRALIEEKIADALAKGVAEMKDGDVLVRVINIGDTLQRVGSAVNLNARIQQRIAQEIARLQAEGEQVSQARKAIKEAQEVVQGASEVAPDTAGPAVKVIEAIPEPLQQSGAMSDVLGRIASLSPEEIKMLLKSLQTET